MEQARQWMWTKRKHGLSPHLQGSNVKPSYGDSWEELAFAEDAAGPLGGCIWPPRSYTCSFCRREFRSAQALGGHMNVHRRDRARLKQSSSPQNEILDLDHHNHQTHLPNPCSSFDVKYPSQVCSLVYNPNPNLDNGVLGSSSSPPSRVFVPPTQENCGQKITMVPPLSSSHVFQEQNKRTSLSSPQTWSNLVADKYFQISDSRKDDDKKSNQESGGRAKGEFVKADLSVSLNLVVCHTFPITSEDEEEAASRKRRRTDTTLLPFFLEAGGSVDRHDLQSDVLELSSSSIEDLDLELRL